MKPFAIISDIHFHNWSAFQTETPEGNSRLLLIIEEVRRAARELKKVGGDLLIVAGDVFHVRGSIAPSVLNPVIDLFRELVNNEGLKVHIIAGNHDLEGDISNRLGSAVTSLARVGCRVVNNFDGAENIATNDGAMIGLLPWTKDLGELKKHITGMGNATFQYVVIHAPVNGVIKGLPENGLDPVWLGKQGLKGVFSGHYHNHKDFGNGVYSIGAIGHHTFSDIGSKAGFLIVSDEGVKFHASHLPNFIDLDSSMDDMEMQLAADGNYVRARVNSSDLVELNAIRELLVSAGAKGVSVQAQPRKASVERESSAAASGLTLAQSVAVYVDKSATDYKTEVAALCQELLDKAQEVV